MKGLIPQCSVADLEDVGEVEGDGLEQHAVGQQLGGLPAGDVGVAPGHQGAHLIHGLPRVDVVTQGLVHRCSPVEETARTNTHTHTPL